MEQVIVNNNKDYYKIMVVKKRNFKKLTLRINSKLQPQLSMPYGVSYKQAHSFILSNLTWLVQQINKTNNSNDALKRAIADNFIVCCGTKYLINLGLSNKKNSKVIIKDDVINIAYTNYDNVTNLLIKAIKTIAFNYFMAKSNHYCSILNKSINKLIITDTKSKWGSCSNKGNIRINFRVSLAPIAVIDYLIAHEITHLKHFDHSNNFWQTLEDIYGTYKEQKLWLKNNGALLF